MLDNKFFFFFSHFSSCDFCQYKSRNLFIRSVKGVEGSIKRLGISTLVLPLEIRVVTFGKRIPRDPILV